jgi:hypothetical protein
VVDYSVQAPVVTPPHSNNTGRHFELHRPSEHKVSSTANDTPSSSVDHYTIGSQVLHEHFGRGVVQKREGDGERLKLTIIFREYGSKKVLANFAPMHPF